MYILSIKQILKGVLNMKKKILVITLLFLLVGSACIFAEENYDIRQLKWGMSKDEVIEIEGIPNRSNEDELVYAEILQSFSSVKQREFKIFLNFNTNNELYKLKYQYVNSAEDEAVLIVHFRIFLNDLIDKYGYPDEQEQDNDVNFMLKDKAKTYAKWTTNTKEIYALMERKDKLVRVVIDYRAKNIQGGGHNMSKF